MSAIEHLPLVHELASWTDVISAPKPPNPAPHPPPGLSGKVNTLLSWWKWIALALGVFGLIGCGALMIAGQRNRHNLAADGATGIPWVLGGLTLIVLSSGVAGVFYG